MDDDLQLISLGDPQFVFACSEESAASTRRESPRTEADSSLLAASSEGSPTPIEGEEPYHSDSPHIRIFEDSPEHSARYEVTYRSNRLNDEFETPPPQCVLSTNVA